MQQQPRAQTYFILSQAIGYLLAGLFIWTVKDVGINEIVLQAISGIFILFAFFLVIASSVDVLTPWAYRISGVLAGGLFLASVARLIHFAVNNAEDTVILIAAIIFVLLVPVAVVYSWFRQMRIAAQRVGPRELSVRIFITIAVTLSMFAGTLLLLDVSTLGNPLWYIAGGLLSLSISAWIEHG
jgi:hypothetical protein